MVHEFFQGRITCNSITVFFIMMKTPGGTNLTNSVLVLFFIFYVL